MAHGGDVVLAGPREGIEEVKGRMKEWYGFRVRTILGREDDDEKDIVELGCVVSRCRDGVEWDADAKQDRLIREK